MWADAARKTATSLNTYPVIRFLGHGPDDAAIARKREALIAAQMQDINMFTKQVDTFVTADLYGVAISQVAWRRQEETRIVEETARLPISGQMIRTIRKADLVTFDGPDIENVDRLDFFPQPGMKSIDKMRWVVRRLYLDIDDVLALARQGIFDTSEVLRLKREGSVNASMIQDDAMVRRFQVRVGYSEEEARTMDRFNRPVELLEYWGYVPNELADDGAPKRVITVANRRYLFRNKALPFWHGKLPFITFAPMPDPHYFDAPGKAEVAEKLQIVANRYINQALDAADLTIDPMWFYDRSSNLNTRNLYARPGRFIPVDGNPNQVVAPLMGNLNGIATARGLVDDASRFMQIGHGIYEDAVQGAQGDSRQTAREFIGRREAAGTRLLLESKIYEATFLEPCANMMVALDKQFLELPVEVLILGANSQIDPVTGAPIPEGRETLDGYDLVPNYAARAVGATSRLSEETTQQNMLQLVQLLTASPQTMGAINQINFWRQIFREFEIPNVNEIFMPAQNPLAGIVQQATGGQGGIGQVPTSGQMVNGQSDASGQVAGQTGGLQQLGIPGNPGIPGPVDLKNIPLANIPALSPR